MRDDIDDLSAASIGAGDYAYNWFLRFDLPSGTYGYHLGWGPYTWNGVEYLGAGKALEIDQIDSGVDLSASPLQVKLNEIEDLITPDVLAAIDDEAYKGRPASLVQAYFSRESGELVLALPWWEGTVDVVTHHETPGGQSYVLASLEPMSLDHSRISPRMRSDEDQRSIDPDDGFFRHAATIGEKIAYGRKDAT